MSSEAKRATGRGRSNVAVKCMKKRSKDLYIIYPGPGRKRPGCGSGLKDRKAKGVALWKEVFIFPEQIRSDLRLLASRTTMLAKSLAAGVLSVGLLSLSSCVVGVGNWERYSKDFHFNYPLKAGGSITVETFNGSIDISGWDEETVDISGTKYGRSPDEADNLKVDVNAGPTSVSVRVPQPSMWRNNLGAKLVIKVPRNTQFDRITTSNSSIRTQDGSGPARLRTSNGSIRVVDLRGDLEAHTSNSSIELQRVDGDARLHSSNGHIRASRVSGLVDASTSNSSISVDVQRPDRPVRVDTSNGSVDVSLPAAFSSPLRVGTNNAPITVRLNDGINARISARTSNSSIKTDVEIRAQGELSKNRLDGVLGSGGPLFDLSTSNGSINLVRR
jgi:DUF4097 and DUF4098 domain-containing protein YvlB